MAVPAIKRKLDTVHTQQSYIYKGLAAIRTLIRLSTKVPSPTSWCLKHELIVVP